jgi:hypothetical protein
MTFTPTYLKAAEQSNVSLGTWKGYSVRAICKENIYGGNYRSDTAYIIYDDGNKIFIDGLIYGIVSRDGNVDERRPYKYIKEISVPKKVEEKEKEEIDYKSETIGDVNLEIEVDNMLKCGRSTTIDELLKGFDYGL